MLRVAQKTGGWWCRQEEGSWLEGRPGAVGKIPGEGVGCTPEGLAMLGQVHGRGLWTGGRRGERARGCRSCPWSTRGFGPH